MKEIKKLNRLARVSINKKQERITIKDNPPLMSELTEGLPVLRKVAGRLAYYVKYKNQIYISPFVEGNLINSGSGFSDGSTNEDTLGLPDGIVDEALHNDFHYDGIKDALVIRPNDLNNGLLWYRPKDFTDGVPDNIQLFRITGVQNNAQTVTSNDKAFTVTELQLVEDDASAWNKSYFLFAHTNPTPGVNTSTASKFSVDNLGNIYSAGTLTSNVNVSSNTLTTSAAQNKVIIEGAASDVDLGAYEIRAQTFESDVSTGTAPFTIASTTVVTNLNADKLDGADLVDEDNMASNSATKIPTQQSVKAYVDSEITGLVDSAPGALDTLNELAAALNDDASFSTTITNSLATKVGLTGNETIAGEKIFSSALRVGDGTEGIKLSVLASNITGIEGMDTGSAGWNSIHIKADGNDGLFIEKDTNKVGIGTTSPTEPLEVWSAETEAYHYPFVIRNPYNHASDIDFGVGMKFKFDDGSEAKWAGIAYEADATYGNSGDLKFYVDGATQTAARMTLSHEGNLDVVGNITNATWTGDVIASAYLDSDTAHLTTDQTFTGRKTFNKAFPQVIYTDDSSTDYVSTGLSGNTFFHKSSDDDINFGFRNASNDDILMIDSGDKAVLVNDTSAGSFNFKIGDNGRMNFPARGMEMENSHGYYNALGDLGLNYILMSTNNDLLRHQTPLTLERWNGIASAWVDAISGTTSENNPTTDITGLKNLLDGMLTSGWQLDDEWRKFRFVIQRESAWADNQTIYLEMGWSSTNFNNGSSASGSMCPTLTVEMLDGSYDASDDSNNDWTTHTAVTTDWHTTGVPDNWGLYAFHKTTGMHHNDTHVRITVEFPAWDASAGGNTRVNLKNIGILSSYATDRNTQVWTTNFDRDAVGYGKLSIPGNANIDGNVAIGDVNDASVSLHIKEDSVNARMRVQSTSSNSISYMRLENDAQNWDIRVDGGNSDKFIIRDETGSTNRFLMDTSGNIETTGNIVPAGYLQLTGAPSDPGADGTVRLGEETNVLKIFSNYGYIRLGAESASWAHIRTDRSQFYFDKRIVVDEGIVSSYDEDLILRRDYNDTTYNQITIGDDTLDIKLDNTSRLAIDGNGQVDLSGDLVLRGERGIFIENLGSPTGTSTSYGGSIIQPATAMYRTATNAHTGFIKIVVPTSTGADPRDMLTFWVDVFDYASGDSFSAYISGYNYQDVGSNEWHNCGAIILGTESHRDFTVRFCHDDTNPCITIGETDTAWNYLQVTVRNVQVGFTADIDDFKGDWTITVETSLPSVVDETISGNFPIASRTIGTADIATTVTLTDESSDSTCFPVFSTANTGDRNLHTDSSALTYNASNGTLISTYLEGSYLTATTKLNITTSSDAIATFTMTDDAWGYMEWKKNSGDRQGYFGMSSDMTKFILATEDDADEFEINVSELDINGNVSISSNLNIGGHNFNDIDIGSEFVDSDDHIMSSGAIKEKIESYGYTTNTGDATLAGTQTFSGAKTFSANAIFGGDITINADGKIKSDTSGTWNFIEFDDDSGSPENQTLVSSVTNVVAIVDGNNNGTGQFEILKGGTDGTATELFRLENDGDAVFTGDLYIPGEKKIQFDSADTTIYTNSDNPEDLYIESDEDMYLRPDDNLVIACGTTNYVTFDGTNQRVGIGTSPTTTLDVEGTVSYKHTAFTTAGPTDDVDVSGTTVLECDTSGGHITIGGFTGGVQGQMLYVVKTSSDFYRVILENNEGGGSQDIFSSTNANVTITSRGGVTLYCNGTSWFMLNK